MGEFGTFADIGVERRGRVGIVEIRRPPDNFFDRALIVEIGAAFEALDRDDEIRALVLCAAGKNFCAGGDFSAGGQVARDAVASGAGSSNLYKQAIGLFRTRKPVVGAIQGAAVGGGLGLALVPDFRVTCAEGRFVANFTALGTHPGFGLTTTLPRLVGQQRAEMMFYTAERVRGDRAVEIGLADLLVPLAEVRTAAIDLAARMAGNAPLALMATRAIMRRGLVDAIGAATDHEFVEQEWLFKTGDFKEGVRAMAARATPDFRGR